MNLAQLKEDITRAREARIRLVADRKGEFAVMLHSYTNNQPPPDTSLTIGEWNRFIDMLDKELDIEDQIESRVLRPLTAEERGWL